MKTLFFFVSVVMLSLSISAQSLPNPKFVEDQIKIFNSNDSYKNHVAFADTWAWGTALRTNGSFVIWFAFTNTDAYFQIKINDALSGEEREIILKQKDALDKNYDVFVNYCCSESWIGISKDWSLDIYNKKLFNAKNKSYKSLVVNNYLWDLVESGVITKFRVGEYL